MFTRRSTRGKDNAAIRDATTTTKTINESAANNNPKVPAVRLQGRLPSSITSRELVRVSFVDYRVYIDSIKDSLNAQQMKIAYEHQRKILSREASKRRRQKATTHWDALQQERQRLTDENAQLNIKHVALEAQIKQLRATIAEHVQQLRDTIAIIKRRHESSSTLSPDAFEQC